MESASKAEGATVKSDEWPSDTDDSQALAKTGAGGLNGSVIPMYSEKVMPMTTGHGITCGFRCQSHSA
jgi:hypothetical protein